MRKKTAEENRLDEILSKARQAWGKNADVAHNAYQHPKVCLRVYNNGEWYHLTKWMHSRDLLLYVNGVIDGIALVKGK